MYEITSKPLVRRTRHTLRSAEFGFFGVVVYTRVHTPRFCGHASRAGTVLFTTCLTRGLRTSWLIVAIKKLLIALQTCEKSSPQTRGREILCASQWGVKIYTVTRAYSSYLARVASGYGSSMTGFTSAAVSPTRSPGGQNRPCR